MAIKTYFTKVSWDDPMNSVRRINRNYNGVPIDFSSNETPVSQLVCYLNLIGRHDRMTIDFAMEIPSGDKNG